ncbi:MAG: DUF1554 domain-containing protein [Candidatus Diapherotrites archaeon]
MLRGLTLIALMGAVALLFGCAGQMGTPEEIAMQNATVKNFMQQYPNATVQINRHGAEAFAGIADEIRKDCQNPDLQAKEYYKVVVNDAASGDYIKAWIDWEGKKLECMYRKGQKVSETAETGKGTGEKAAEKCTAGWACKDAMHKAYRNEDCNWDGEKFCEFGCGAGRCLASDEGGATAGAGGGSQQGGENAADLCAGIVCPNTCEGSVRKFNGTCVNGVCNYSVTACGQGCENGACKGNACAGIVCPNTCEGDFINKGKCVEGACTSEQIQCPYGCENGGCRDAPAEQANEQNQEQNAGEQQNQEQNQEQNQGQECAGGCPDKCEGNLRTHAGQCVNGECQYAQEQCANGCENGVCKAASGGAAYSCGWTWPQQIKENGVLKWACPSSRPYCKGGTTNCCQYNATQGHYDCIDCVQGACTNLGGSSGSSGSDPCANVTCPNKCVNTTRYYNGKCNSNGQCDYSLQACPNGCTNGTCNNDPCAGVSCPNTCASTYSLKYNGQCSNGVCQYTTKACFFGCSNNACSQPPVGTIFVTSTTYNASLGGLAGADAKCTARASAGSLTGTWKALISNTVTNAKDRIPDTVHKGLDGLTIANNEADLFDGTIANRIYFTEMGTAYSGAPDYVWTGFETGGIATGVNCGNWASTSGNTYPGSATGTGSGWMKSGVQRACSTTARLYCIKTTAGWDKCEGVTCPNTCDGSYREYNGQCQGINGICKYTAQPCAFGCTNGACNTAPVGAIFRTSTTYTGSLGGMAGADMKCQQRANAASLAGVWKAVISDSLKNAGDSGRIPDTVYKRMDGLVIANNKADLFDGTVANAPKLSENGLYVSDLAWTGFTTGGTPTGVNCGNWQSTSGNAYPGHASYTDAKWFNWNVSKACSTAAGLYCVRYS